MMVPQIKASNIHQDNLAMALRTAILPLSRYRG